MTKFEEQEDRADLRTIRYKLAVEAMKALVIHGGYPDCTTAPDIALDAFDIAEAMIIRNNDEFPTDDWYKEHILKKREGQATP